LNKGKLGSKKESRPEFEHVLEEESLHVSKDKKPSFFVSQYNRTSFGPNKSVIK